MPIATSLPGFRDFYPAELSVRNHILRSWREAARRYGFEEYDGPPLEPLDLYIEKSGEEIVAQLYRFEDKGGRAVALRPEMTPTLARMVGARAGALRKPIRWFSVPQLFRYERAQRGRLREHYQWNVDIVGEPDTAADAEVLAVALEGLRLLGLEPEDVVARFNDRRLLERLLAAAGVAQDHILGTFSIVDKLTREPEDRIRARLIESGLDVAVADRVLAIFRVDGLEGVQRAYGGVAGVGEEIERLTAYRAHLSALELGRYVAFDPAIVRGLAYYTGIVFEVFDRRGELRAICGGGRYDTLLESVSAVSLPAVGFGMGDVVLGELLRERGLLPEQSAAADYYIVCVRDAEEPLKRRIATYLRRRGHAVLYSLRPAGLRAQFKDADARGARQVVVLGPDELAEGVALVRDMATGKEERVPLEALGAAGVTPGGGA